MIVINCQDSSLLPILSIVKRIMFLIQIIVPILLLVWATISFIKLVKNPEEKNGIKKIVNQFLAAGIVFFVPLIVNVVMMMLGDTNDISSCWLAADDIISISNEYQAVNEKEKKKIIPNAEDYEKGNSFGLRIAELAVRVAPVASPDNTTFYAPWNFHHDSISEKCGSYYTPNPWYPPSLVDPRYKDFEKIMDAVMDPPKSGNKAYGSCAQAAAGIIRAIADPDFETSHPHGQIVYMSNNTEKWDLVYQMKPGEKYDEVCEPGDLLITDQGWTHSMIYVGNDIVREKFSNSNGNIFQAGYDDCDHARYPRIDYMGTTPVPFNIYRPTGDGNFKYEFIDVEEVLGS